MFFGILTTRRVNLLMQPCKVSAPAFLARAALAFLTSWAVLFLLLLGAYALPGAPVRQNIARSAPTLQREGLYPEFFGFKLFQMDNYTDTVMLFEAASADETAPLTAMMTNTAYNVDNFETLADDLAAYLAAREAGEPLPDTLEPFSYARYWHGYLIWLRPLLCLMPYTGVRVVQYLVLAALLAGVLWGLRRQAGWRAAVWFAASQALVSVFFVPHQVQFFTCFAIAYAGCCWVLAKPRGVRQLALALVVLGVATSFCDLLVTPILTLGLPVAVWLLCVPQRLAAGPRQCAAVAAGSLCWGVGYGGCWALKWVLAGAITGQDVIGDAVRQIGVRTTGATWHGIELTWGNILRFVLDTLHSRGLFWPLAAVCVLALALFALCLRGRQALATALPLGLTALMAPAWLALLRTHSIQHGWFTWRALGVTLFAGLAFVSICCSWKTGLRRLTRRGRQQED